MDIKHKFTLAILLALTAPILGCMPSYKEDRNARSRWVGAYLHGDRRGQGQVLAATTNMAN